MPDKIKTIKTKKYEREVVIERAEPEGEGDRSIALAFSSEEPVERWFGTEILDHDPRSVRLDWFKSGRAPLLLDHNSREQIGVIESVTLGTDRRGRAVVRFGKGARAQEILSDVRDGIRSNISVGYRLHEIVLEKSSDKEGETYRATDWEPLEVSIVAIPADQSVGVGRADVDEYETTVRRKEAAMPEDKVTEPAKTVPAQAVDHEAQRRAVDQAKQEVRDAENVRIRSIQRLADYHKCPELGREAIEKGWSYQEANDKMLAERESKPLPPPDPTIGMSTAETQRYSMVRVINALTNPENRRAREAARFELEASEAAASKLGITPRGILIPEDVQRAAASEGLRRAIATRALNVTTAAQGGNIVATDLLAGSFVDLLRNRSAIVNAGAFMMGGLVGNVDIPKQTGAGTAYWLSAETTAVTESTPAIGQVEMTPKTVGAYTRFTRNLLLQSSIDVEAFVRMELSRILALAIDRAALYGSGSNGEPTGVANQVGVNMPLWPTTLTWARVVDMETQIEADNADIGSMWWIIPASTKGAMKTTVKESGQASYLMEADGTCNGYGHVLSNQVDAQEAFFGVWSQLIVGMWGGLDLALDPHSDLLTRQTRVVAYQSCDIAVRHVQAFCYGTPSNPSASV